MAFDLQKVKWINLLKSLAKFRLPRIRWIKLDAVPSDSEVVKAFIKNSIPIQNQFDFNVAKQLQIKGSIYLEALKSAASKTYDVLNIHNTELSSQEFWEIVSAGRYCKKLQFCFDLITFDEMWDFKGDMNGCKIEYLYLLSSGSSDYSDWSNHPQRFKNLIAAIAKCAPLSKSLKVLNISKCEISKTRVIEIWNNYNLIALRIIL